MLFLVLIFEIKGGFKEYARIIKKYNFTFIAVITN